tara:strand:- start:172 stop:669 length:498 start_codon:yes stop_codon:yes gene_type:complete
MIKKYNVIDNYLPKNEFLKIKNEIVDNEYFPWYFNNYKSGNDKNNFLDYQFVHTFVINGKINSFYFNKLNPLIKKLKIKKLLRLKANLNPISHKIIEFKKHRDRNEKGFTSAIFYLNTNNGYTKIGNKKIQSIENRIVIFPSNASHFGTNATNLSNRIILNFVYV